MSYRSSHLLGRRALGANLLRTAALLGLRTVAGSQLLSSASLFGGCADEAREGEAEGGEGASFVPLVHVDADAVVIGTGYGGAVVAKRLSEKGVSVLMLEMGRLWNTPGPDGKVFCGATSPDGRAMWFRDKLVLGGLMPLDIDIPVSREAGILDVVQSPAMNVYCGRGVGGGSLVNMAMLVTPPRDVLMRTLPTVDPDAMLSTYYPRALDVLRGNSVRRAFWESTPWYQYSRVGYAASKAAGFDAQFLTSGYDYRYMEAVFSMDIPFPIGLETFASFNIVMTENPEAGKFVYNPISDQAELVWQAGQNDPAVASARFVFDKMNSANWTSYKPEMFRGKELLDDTTYHPVGGCPLGAATEDYGRLHGYDNLYVADSSLIPRGLVANPALTVAALAERNVERILAEDFKV